MTPFRRDLTLSPVRIAGIYLVFGVVWILATDTIVYSIAETQSQITRQQTIKGWIFVLISTVLVFTLVVNRDAQLNSERRFHELALDSLSDIFVVLDRDGRITRVNEQAADVTGHSKSELLGMEATEYVMSEDQDSLAAAITDAYETGRSQVECTLTTREGKHVRYEFRGRRMEESDETVRGIAVIGRDITTRVLTEQRLEVALRVLRHNLRNKLTIIRGWAEWDAESGVSSDGLEQIQETVDYLIEVSEKSRTMAELGSGRDIRRTEIDVQTTLLDILEEFQARYPDVEFETAIRSGSNSIDSHGLVFETAIENLVENAIEHNDTGDRWVRVELETAVDSVHIRIHDNGSGIPHTEREVLEKGIETPLAHSSGLGLWLVNWCVTILGGSVYFEDRQHAGSVVTVTLPTTPSS